MQECSQRRHWIATLHAGFEHKKALNKRKTIRVSLQNWIGFDTNQGWK